MVWCPQSNSCPPSPLHCAELSKLIQDVYGQHSGAQHVKTFVSATPGTSYLRTDGPVNVDLLAIAESYVVVVVVHNNTMSDTTLLLLHQVR